MSSDLIAFVRLVVQHDQRLHVVTQRCLDEGIGSRALFFDMLLQTDRKDQLLSIGFSHEEVVEMSQLCKTWMAQWTIEQVVAYFRSLGQKNVFRLEQERIDGGALVLLSESDLRSLGISFIPLRKHLASLPTSKPAIMTYAPPNACPDCGGREGHIPSCKQGCGECGGRGGHTPNCSQFTPSVDKKQNNSGGGSCCSSFCAGCCRAMCFEACCKPLCCCLTCGCCCR
jgi:hypothetical protein